MPNEATALNAAKNCRRPQRRSACRVLLSAGLMLFSSFGAAQQPAPLPAKKPATDGKVWGALIFAVNDASKLTGSAEKAPEGQKDLTKRLAKVFPYQHYEILGQHLQDVLREYESWVVPTRDLFLKIDSKGPAADGGMNLHLQVWREQQVLVKTDAVLHPQSPLFIGGPKWRDGQLIFVLESQKK
ncbi:MAG: hypothetical protein IPK32_16510 [Verrucomicrobiaceae bacterium]|nr:hypothetical protein [Verrucomicrobiaceae bacterium]